jgi:hypothetical protein
VYRGVSLYTQFLSYSSGMINNQPQQYTWATPSPLSIASGILGGYPNSVPYSGFPQQPIQTAQPAPQTPTQFAYLSVDAAREINSGLETLRFKLFGDQGEQKDVACADCPPESFKPLQDLTSRIHFELCRALDHLDIIAKRL